MLVDFWWVLCFVVILSFWFSKQLYRGIIKRVKSNPNGVCAGIFKFSGFKMWGVLNSFSEWCWTVHWRLIASPSNHFASQILHILQPVIMHWLNLIYYISKFNSLFGIEHELIFFVLIFCFCICVFLCLYLYFISICILRQVVSRVVKLRVGREGEASVFRLNNSGPATSWLDSIKTNLTWCINDDHHHSKVIRCDYKFKIIQV